jgi:hypothetical protein
MAALTCTNYSGIRTMSKAHGGVATAAGGGGDDPKKPYKKQVPASKADVAVEPRGKGDTRVKRVRPSVFSFPRTRSADLVVSLLVVEVQ